MKMLFKLADLEGAKSIDTFPFECEWCHHTFYIQYKYIKNYLKHKKRKFKYCSPQCVAKASIRIIKEECGNCGKEIYIKPYVKKQSKSGKNFCSQSCGAIYNNTHKTYGIRRSKLEKWLEEQLTIYFPDLEIIYNKKETINSELDIYIPSLNLAFELNGIFHYEPIYGQDKLVSIKNNDNRKFQACLEKNIELVIIDASKLTYFIPKNINKYYEIISRIIQFKLSGVGEI